jgi:DNA-binding SARP family transcriptional activator
MEFRVLGPLEVQRDGRALDLRGSKRRAVLALLVLQANEVVRTDRLIDELWGDHQPANATAALHNHVSRLRKDLGAEVLVTKPWGYVLRADPDSIDLRRFERLVAEARPLPARERSAKLGEALALWRGPALADLAQDPALEAERARVDELRQSVIEQRIDARLELGQDAEVVPELEELVAEHPLREPLRGQLILALYRSGRQAEALETYRETRRVLVEELGIEPSPELRELERAILRQDPALVTAPSPSEPPMRKPPPSRWRWPRSPLIAGAAALLLVLAGLAAAILATPRSGTPHASAARPPSTNVLTITMGSTTTVVTSKAHDGASSSDPNRPAPRHGKSNRPQPTHQAKASATSSRPESTTKPAEHRPKSDPAAPPTAPPPPAAPPTPAPPAPPVLMADNFDDGTIDTNIWQPLLTGTGSSVTEQNSRLELAFDADAAAAPNSQGFRMVAAQVGTACRFRGDFDVRVGYELVDWPPENGVMLQLAAWFPASITTIARQSQRWGENYVASRGGGSAVNAKTNDLRGALRLRRKGSLISSYVQRGGRWSRVSSWSSSGAPLVGLQALSTDEWFGDQPVTVAFDNFEIKAAHPVC